MLRNVLGESTLPGAHATGDSEATGTRQHSTYLGMSLEPTGQVTPALDFSVGLAPLSDLGLAGQWHQPRCDP